MQINSINTPSFGSHLTPRFIKIIENTDPQKTELKLAKLGIKADFEGNKTVAACVWQTAKIFKALGLPLPKKISLFFDNKQRIGGVAQSNFQVKFNISSLKNFHQYDRWRSMLSEHSLISTGHFLTVFLHEFTHNANFHRISQNKQWTDTPIYRIFSLIKEIKAPSELKNYIFKKYNFYEEKNDMTEIFADIMQRRITDSLDTKTLMPRFNPFTEIALPKQKCESDQDYHFNRLLNSIYNGDIENIQSEANTFSPLSKLPDLQATPFFIVVKDINKFLQRFLPF